MSLNSIKVLVIGGAGFMGSHTADMLESSGYDVTIMDIVKSKWLRGGQKEIIGDINNQDNLVTAMEGMDYVYHFAGIADIAMASKNPFITIHSNIIGVTNVIEAAVKTKIKKIFYASTMYVYSTYGSFYRASKQAGEIIIEAYSEKSNIEYVFLRYGSLYGPRAQNWNGIRDFANQIVKSGKVNFNGDGSEIREYIHVKDAAKLSVDVLEKDYSNCAITITGQQTYKISDLLSILFEIAGKPKIINYQAKNGLNDHYGNTPYRYSPKTAKKIVPTEFVDLGQGLLELIEEVNNIDT